MDSVLAEKIELVGLWEGYTLIEQQFVGGGKDGLAISGGIPWQPLVQNVDALEAEVDVPAADIFDFGPFLKSGDFVVLVNEGVHLLLRKKSMPRVRRGW